LSLQAFAFGLVGFSFVKILAPAYFAREDTRTPVRIGLIALCVNFVLSIILAYTMTLAGYEGTHAGLALAISVAAILNAWLLHRGLCADGIIKHPSDWAIFLIRVAAALTTMFFCLNYLGRPLEWWLQAGMAERSLWLTVVVTAGAGVYFMTLYIVGLRFSQLRHRSG
jgi:putative peptidoglycan lipid II flippase